MVVNKYEKSLLLGGVTQICRSNEITLKELTIIVGVRTKMINNPADVRRVLGTSPTSTSRILKNLEDEKDLIMRDMNQEGTRTIGMCLTENAEIIADKYINLQFV